MALKTLALKTVALKFVALKFVALKNGETSRAIPTVGGPIGRNRP